MLLFIHFYSILINAIRAFPKAKDSTIWAKNSIFSNSLINSEDLGKLNTSFKFEI